MIDTVGPKASASDKLRKGGWAKACGRKTVKLTMIFKLHWENPVLSQIKHECLR